MSTNESQATAATESVSVVLGAKKSIAAVKEVLGGQRKTFKSFDDAIAKVSAIGEKLTELGDSTQLPVIAAGVGDLSKVESMDDERLAWAKGEYAVGVGFLGLKRPASEGGMAIRGIVIFPVPTVEQYINSDAGNDWLTKIATKETAHVAFRALRNVDASAGVEALYQTAMRIPKSADEFAEEQRASGLDTGAFDQVWAGLRKEVIKAFPALKESLPAKGEVINCIRSKSYAEAEYPDLESQDIFLFLGKAAHQFAQALEDDEVDAGELESWIESRGAINIPPKERKTLDAKIDLSAFSLAG